MADTLLAARNVEKSYGSGEDAILRGITLDIVAGEYTVIMGPSGAGKSTLLYALSGMEAVSAGSILYQGQALSGLPDREMSVLRAHGFGFIFQEAHLVSNLTLLENVAVAGYVSGMPQALSRARELLGQLHLTEAVSRLPARVSGGEAQRAAIARAIINDPGILFADEPTGALNRSNTQEVLDILSALHAGGQTILLVTHDIRSAVRGSRILYLEDGQILSELALEPYQKTKEAEREEALSSWLRARAW